jgi:hypothetical protein
VHCKSADILEEHITSIFKDEKYAVTNCCLRHADFLLPLLFSPGSGGKKHIPPKERLSFKGLHNSILQKTELSVITAVRASNPK